MRLTILLFAACLLCLAASAADPVALLVDARAAQDAGDPARAEALLTAAIAESPASSEAYLARGFLRLRQKQRDLAAADFIQAVAVDPTNPRAHLIRGDLAYRLIQGNFAACEADYATVLKLDPDFPHFRAYSAELYLYLRRPERVIEEALQGLLTEPNAPIHKINLAHGLAFSGHVEAAKVAYAAVARTDIERGLTGAALALGDYAQLKRRDIVYPQMAELTAFLEQFTQAP